MKRSVTIEMDEIVYGDGRVRAASLGVSFVKYIQTLIIDDIKKNPVIKYSTVKEIKAPEIMNCAEKPLEDVKKILIPREYGGAVYTGVYKIGEKYRASIGVNGKTIHLGVFSNKKDALECYLSAKKEYNKKPRNKYKYKGVRWRSDYKKWVAEIRVGKICEHIGYYETEEDAAEAYNNAIQKIMGELAVINNITPNNC